MKRVLTSDGLVAAVTPHGVTSPHLEPGPAAHGGPYGHGQLEGLEGAVQLLLADLLVVNVELDGLVIPLDGVAVGHSAGVSAHIEEEEVLLASQEHVGLGLGGGVALELEVDLILLASGIITLAAITGGQVDGGDHTGHGGGGLHLDLEAATGVQLMIEKEGGKGMVREG